MDGPAPHLARGAPERMRGNREAPLLMYRVDRRGSRHSGLDATLEEEADDVTVPAGHLFADDDMKPPAFGGAFCGAKRSLNRVVIRHRDQVERSSAGSVVDQLRWCRPTVAGVRVHVEVGPTPGNHGCSILRPPGLPSAF